MKRLIIVLVVLLGVGCMAQPGKTYTSLKDVTDPMKVYHLKLSYKRLKQVPPEVREMKNLETLDLSKNFIDTLPAWIGELVNIKSLDISRNWLHYLPEEMGRLHKLELLDASRNPLQELPITIGELTAMKQLVIWQTGIVELPLSIVALDATLKAIDMRACQLTKEDQEQIDMLLPNAKKIWDQACNCTR